MFTSILFDLRSITLLNLIPAMLRRLFLVFLPSLTAQSSFANDSSWNCEQDKQSKEWICVGGNSVETPKITEPTKTPAVTQPEKTVVITPITRSEQEANTPPTTTKTPLSSEIQANVAETNVNIQNTTVKAPDSSQEERPLIRLLEPAFSHQQEQTFSTLTSQLAYDPWEKCNAEPSVKPNFISSVSQRESAPMDVKSNYAEVFENEIGSYSGNVTMSRADQKSTSKKANYNNTSQVLDLQGDVFYSEEELALHSETAMLNFSADQAKLRDAQFIAAAKPLRGYAKFIYRKSKTLSQYKDVAYTSCRPGNQDWIIHSSDLTINKTTGRGAVKDAWLEFKGAPVFYSPYMSFPIDNRRVSGFLMPTFGSTRYSGFRIAAPYYWNIAPNYDATITPRELFNRGPLLAGNFRYLSEQSKGNVAMEYMPSDMLRNNDSRFYGSIKNNSTLSPNIHSNVDLGYVSDPTYFAQMGSALTFSNYNYLKSSADIGYVKEGINFNTSFVNYQSINTTLVNTPLPYRVLPRINLNLDHTFKFMPLNTSMENEYVYFQQEKLVNGQRFNTKPSISIPFETSNAYLVPKLSVQQTNYALSNVSQTGMSDSISRTVPIFSANTGLNFERNLSFSNSSYLHTIEPRLFYLYVPYTNQQDLPVFDTAQYDFQYSALFRENSFSGKDRIQNANQISTAISSKLIDDKTGLEKLKLDVGEIIYFENRQVNAPVLLANGNYANIGANKDNYSNLVTELSSEFTRELSATSGLQWNPLSSDIQRINAAIHYRNKANEIFNVGYLYRTNPVFTNKSNDITQTDSSFRYPIYDNWTAMGRWQYSLLYNKTQDALFGIEKENCCWRFRVALRRYTNNISSGNGLYYGSNLNTPNTHPGTAQNGIFFEIELKGLSALGDDMDTFLQKEIYGFQGSDK